LSDLRRDPPPALRRPAPWAIALGLAALALLIARLRFAVTEPLWFDEAFTLAITMRPDGASFWREVYLDCNGPAYYALLRLWTGVFGHSDLALRLPSLLAVCVAAALPLAWPPKGLTREARITWSALIFAWWGVGYFLDARCYSLLLAVSTLQCLCFARLMDAPGRRAALAWAAVGALAILLHYYAIFLCFAQGVIYLAQHRQRALRTWPGVLAFAPAFAWIAYHAPRLAEYSRLGSVWHPPLDGERGLALVAYVFGPTSPLILPLMAALLVIGLWPAPGRAAPAPTEETRPARPLVLTAAAGVLAFALLVGFSLLGSGLSPRYLIGLAPPLLLGVVLVARAGPRANLTCLALVALFFAVQVRPTLDALASPQDLPRYEFHTASTYLMAQGVTDVTFVWDHEVVPIIDPTTLARVGAVFFDRAGYPVRVRPLVVDRDHDPNLAIVAAAQGARPGLIWIFHRKGQTAASRFLPAIGRRNPDWTCAEQGDGNAGSLGCHRPPKP